MGWVGVPKQLQDPALPHLVLPFLCLPHPTPSPSPLFLQVSFRYHCQLYSEWRRTNQKVRLMLPDARNPSPVPHSLLSAKLLKKKADETTV